MTFIFWKNFISGIYSEFGYDEAYDCATDLMYSGAISVDQLDLIKE